MASEEQTDVVQTTEGLTLKRELGLLGLVAVSVCTVIGGGINVLSVEIQHTVHGVGWMVPLAFVLGVTPAVLCAISYASLASAMPRAGGGYIYISRALHPYIGFIATASKWFGLASVIGLLAYLDTALLRDAAHGWGYTGLSEALNSSAARLWIPLAMVWLFWFINLLGMRTFGATCISLMCLMMAGGVVLIVTGFLNTPDDYARVMAADGVDVKEIVANSASTTGGIAQLIQATGALFFAYIGFATISQAGGETRNPTRLLPRAFIISTAVIAGYYLLYSSAVYHALPWQYIQHATAASESELTAPGLLSPLMPKVLAGFVAFTAAIALANDIPPMLMAVSRLFYSWSRDGIFPRGLAAINRRFQTPHWALTTCAGVATLVVLGCNRWGEQGFYITWNMVVIALLFTYTMVAAGLLTIPKRNPELYGRISFLKKRWAQVVVALGAIGTVAVLFVSTIVTDAGSLGEKLAEGDSLVGALAGSAVVLWLAVMAIASVVFWVMWSGAKRRGEDPMETFKTLPSESLETELAPASE